MATNKKKTYYKLSAKERIQFLELQKVMSSIKFQMTELQKQFDGANNAATNLLNSFVRKGKVDGNTAQFNLTTLEFEPKA